MVSARHKRFVTKGLLLRSSERLLLKGNIEIRRSPKTSETTTMIDFACILNSGTDEIGKNHAETDSKARSTNSRGGDDILRYNDFVN